MRPFAARTLQWPPIESTRSMPPASTSMPRTAVTRPNPRYSGISARSVNKLSNGAAKVNFLPKFLREPDGPGSFSLWCKQYPGKGFMDGYQ